MTASARILYVDDDPGLALGGHDDGEALTVWTEPGASGALAAFLERMKFMMRAEITDVTADLALTAHRSGEGDAAALARDACDLAAAAGDPAALAQGHNLLGMLAADPAELERSLALAEELERALEDFPGTVVLATHDRWVRRRWRGRVLRVRPGTD